MTGAQSSPLCDGVCMVQYNQSLLILSVHTHTHTHKGLHLLSSFALYCGSMLHTGMAEWTCISVRLGFIPDLSVCVCQGGGGVALRLVSSSNHLLLWVSSSLLTGPQLGAKARKFSPDCFWSLKMYPQHFLSSHFVSVLSAHPVCWFWEQAVWMVQGQKASNAISPRTDVFFF